MIQHAYIHIPFCIRKCYYCSFISDSNLYNKDIYLDSLISEIKYNYKFDRLKTLYFGGGTPSLLDPSDFAKIISLFSFQPNPEITIEANPESVSKDKFKAFFELGINRISLGVQSFNDNILHNIGRLHSQKDIFSAIKILKSIGFENISIDLIYGLPSQSILDFISDLEKSIAFDIQHISAYGLHIDENSFFAKNPPDYLPDDDLQAQMYLHLCQFLRQYHFLHYEISNFAKHNFYSQHNLAYWLNKHYYGFGLSASGYESNIRYKNTSNFSKYISNPLVRDEELILLQDDILDEEIFLALRLSRGINIEHINRKFDIDFQQKYSKTIKKYINLGLLKISNEHCFLTENGFLLSNNIMSEFLH